MFNWIELVMKWINSHSNDTDNIFSIPEIQLATDANLKKKKSSYSNQKDLMQKKNEFKKLFVLHLISLNIQNYGFDAF